MIQVISGADPPDHAWRLDPGHPAVTVQRCKVQEYGGGQGRVTIRNLNALFKPKSVLLVAGRSTPAPVLDVLIRNLGEGGYTGPLYAVHPAPRDFGRLQALRRLDQLPETPDLALLPGPPAEAPALLRQLGRRGVRAAALLGQGNAATDARLRQRLLNAARPTLLRLLGPDSLGLMLPGLGLNASLSHLPPLPGRLALVAQSGAVISAIVDWTRPRGIGFSHLVALGEMADVDVGDMLDYLARDADTQAILLCLEGISQARKFMSAARTAARIKPVIALKAGRYAEHLRLVAGDGDAHVGTDEVYHAALRRAGILRVAHLDDLFEASAILACGPVPAEPGLIIVSNSRGMGVLAADALFRLGGRLAELSPATREALARVLPAVVAGSNPVDLGDDADGTRYAAVLEALHADPDCGALLVLHCPSALSDSQACAQTVVAAFAKAGRRTLLSSWMGEETAEPARRLLAQHGVPSYPSPVQALRAFMHLVRYREGQIALMETPPSVPERFTPALEQARVIVRGALRARRRWLTEIEVRGLLAAYEIPVQRGEMAQTPEQAAAHARRIGRPVALKLLSPDLVHKTDVGGVALNLDGADIVREEAARMLERVKREHPKLRITGLLVEPMILRPGAFELIAGAVTDPVFGPLVLFGHGGSATELLDDKALALPPLNLQLAEELMSRTRVGRLLRGYRNHQAVDTEALCLTLIKLAQLVADIPEIELLDINPLLADGAGVMVVDAHCRVAPAAGTDRLAIRPYPKELEQDIPLGDGRRLWLRPIMPEDEPALRASFARLTPEEIRMRFFAHMSTLSHEMAARLTQIDYDREMALILTEHRRPGKADIFGSVRVVADPDNERAEFAVIVRHDVAGLGLGAVLMRRIIEYARARGVGEVYGDVLPENTAMLRLGQTLGFVRTPSPDDPELARLTLSLRPAQPVRRGRLRRHAAGAAERSRV